jgi:hypothetical protein
MVVACPMNIDPVCSNGKTYDNACLAVAEFVSLAHKGECNESPEVVTLTESTTSSTGSAASSTELAASSTESDTSSTESDTSSTESTASSTESTASSTGSAASSTGSVASSPTISPAPTLGVQPDSKPTGASSASAALIGTATVLTVSAFIFVGFEF